MKKLTTIRHPTRTDFIKDLESFVREKYNGIVDKGGTEYFQHLLAVANYSSKIADKLNLTKNDVIDCYMVGLLHDIVKDGLLTIYDLVRLGFSDKNIDRIMAVTYVKSHCSYKQHFDDIINGIDFVPIVVKMADDYHNSLIDRFTEPHDKQTIRYCKTQLKHANKLMSRLNGRLKTTFTLEALLD